MPTTLDPAQPGNKAFIRALWLEASAAIVAGTIAVNQTITVYGVVYTVHQVSTAKWGQIVFTDSNGYSYSVPNYACPVFVDADT